MKRAFDRLTEKEFDLVVVGGGSFGACAALDAALSGLSVALIERNDFCSATSAHSFRMIHGGIRYLQHLDFSRLRQSNHERRALLRIAPHLVHPLPIVIPTYQELRKSKFLLGAGGRLYDLLAADRNSGIADPLRHVPPCVGLSRNTILDLFPGLEATRPTGGLLFHDGQMYNPPRLVLSFVHSAADQGAVVANYAEAVGFLESDRRVFGVEVRDRLTNARAEVRARMILNAAGPFTEHLLQRSLDLRLTPEGVYSRDTCFIVPRRLFAHDYGLAVLGATSDPDAHFSRGARHLFIVPWRSATLVGVWHKPNQTDPDGITVTHAELQNYLDEINTSYPSLDLSADDIGLWNAGLVPFGENELDSTNLRYGHRSRIIDHEREHGIAGLVSLIGIRMTTARGDAARAIDLAFRKLGRVRPPCRTDVIPVHGGQIPSYSDWSRQEFDRRPAGVDAESMRALLRNHGTEYQKILRLGSERPELLQRVGDSTVLRAEIVHAVEEEMALRLADVVYRRTDLATAEDPGEAAFRDCAELMAKQLRWSRQQFDDEVRTAVAQFPGITDRPREERENTK